MRGLGRECILQGVDSFRWGLLELYILNSKFYLPNPQTRLPLPKSKVAPAWSSCRLKCCSTQSGKRNRRWLCSRLSKSNFRGTPGLDFGVSVLGIGVWSLGHGVWGFGFGVWGFGFRDWGFRGWRLGVEDWNFEVKVSSLAFTVQFAAPEDPWKVPRGHGWHAPARRGMGFWA